MHLHTSTRSRSASFCSHAWTGCRYAGRGGATIGSVRSSSAAEVEIGARGSAAAGRTLAIRGTEEAVGMAEALVAGLVPLLAVD